jgi:hypothetical protein
MNASVYPYGERHRGLDHLRVNFVLTVQHFLNEIAVEPHLQVNIYFLDSAVDSFAPNIYTALISRSKPER